MESCPTTGLTKPECSCRDCLLDLLAAYAPDVRTGDSADDE
jgi:hypothetical protein